MAKDGFWFKHDYDAMGDPKCAALVEDFGLEGYGLWWAMLELLCQQDGYKLKKFPALYRGLARRWNISPEAIAKQIEAMLQQYGLLLDDDEYIWSPSLLRRMEERHALSDLRAEAGRLGGLRSRRGGEQLPSKSKQLLSKSKRGEERRGEKKEEKEKGPPLPPKGSDCETFADFWDAYPRKTEKQSALKAYITLIKRKESPDDLLTAATNYAALCRDERREAKHIKHAATFLREDRWRDYLTPQATSETGERDDGVRVPNYKTVDELVAEGVIPG